MFAVGFSTRVASSAPRRSRGVELMTSVESPTANTAPRIRNSFPNSLNIHDLEGIEPFVVFEKKKLSIDARLNNMGGCSHNLVDLYMCLMAKRFGEALSVEEASKRIRNSDWDEYLTSKYILLMTIWMNILPV